MEQKKPHGKPHRKYKKGIVADEARRRRQDHGVDIRRKQRDEALQKRRRNTVQTDATFAAPTDPKLVQHISALVAGLRSSDLNQCRTSIATLRKMVSSEQDPPLQLVVDSGVIPILVQMLGCNQAELIFESAWVLTNITSGTTEQTRSVLQHGALPSMIRLLAHPNPEIVDQVVWALGNIAGDCQDFRDACLQSNLVPALLQLFRQGKPALSITRNAVWTVSNLCRGRPFVDFKTVAGPLLPLLKQLITCTDESIVIDSCWALSHLTLDSDSSAKMDAIMDCGLFDRLLTLLANPNAKIVVPTLRAVGNIVSGEDVYTDHAVSKGVVPILGQLLSHENKRIRKEAAWTLSNISAGTLEQMESIIKCGVSSIMIRRFPLEIYDVKKELLWSFKNATSTCATPHILQFYKEGLMQALSQVLPVFKQSMEELRALLQTLDKMLQAGHALRDTGLCNPVANTAEECGLIDHLETLQYHENQGIYQLASHMLKTHFQADEVEPQDVTLRPAAGPASFAFQTPASSAASFQF